MSSFFKFTVSVMAAAALTACGGGGGGGGDSPRYSQADVKNVAILGASSLVLTGDRVGLILFFFGDLLQGISTDAGGSRSGSATSCAGSGGGSGTVAFNLTKSAVRTGLAAGDQLAYTFSNCSFSTGGLVLNGTVVLTAQTAASNLNVNTYQVGYRVAATNFSTASGGTTTAVSGTFDANSALSGGNTDTQRFTVATGQSLTANIRTGSSVVSIAYSPTTTFVSTDTASPNSATRKLDGPLTMATTAGSAAVDVTTPTTLAGNTSSGAFVATSGQVTAKTTDLATSTSISGNTVTVSGDSDRNGSLDLVFSTTWTGLFTL
jgi:hypothetical protein